MGAHKLPVLLILLYYFWEVIAISDLIKKAKIIEKIQAINQVQFKKILDKLNLNASNFYAGRYSLEKTLQAYNEYVEEMKKAIK